MCLTELPRGCSARPCPGTSSSAGPTALPGTDRGTNQGHHGAAWLSAPCLGPPVPGCSAEPPRGAHVSGRRPHSGYFVKLVLIIFSIKHLSAQRVVSFAVSKRVAVEVGAGVGVGDTGTRSRLQGRRRQLCPIRPTPNRGRCGQTRHPAKPLPAAPHPPSPPPQGHPQPRSAAARAARREGREATRVNVTLLLVRFRL